MIPAAFLACALSLPALASTYSPLGHGDNAIFKMLGSFWQEEHRDNGRSPKPVMLIYNPYRGSVASILRLSGLKVFEMSPLAGLSEWAIQGDLEHSPIRRESVHVAWSTERIVTGALLCSLKSMVQIGGFLIVELEEEWMDANLKHNGFELLPFFWRGFRIYKRHHSGGWNGNSHGYRNWQVDPVRLVALSA